MRNIVGRLVNGKGLGNRTLEALLESNESKHPQKAMNLGGGTDMVAYDNGNWSNPGQTLPSLGRVGHLDTTDSSRDARKQRAMAHWPAGPRLIVTR